MVMLRIVIVPNLKLLVTEVSLVLHVILVLLFL